MNAPTTYRLADGTTVAIEPVDGHDLQPGNVVLLWCNSSADPSPYRVVSPEDPGPSVVLQPASGGPISKDRHGQFWRVIPDGTP
jgi:hypothetical protein